MQRLYKEQEFGYNIYIPLRQRISIDDKRSKEMASKGSIHHHGLQYADKKYTKETHCFLHQGVNDGKMFHCFVCNFSICADCMEEDCKYCNRDICNHKNILIVVS